MNGNTGFGMVEPRYVPSYREPQKQGHAIVYRIIIIVELIIIIILGILLAAGISNNENDGREYIYELEGIGYGETKDYANTDASAAIAAWSSGVYGTSLPQSSCKALVSLADGYIVKYGGASAMNVDTCNEKTLSLSVADVQSEVYPFNNLKKIVIGSDDSCAEFNFYSDFSILQSYNRGNTVCDSEMRTVELAEGI